MLGFIDRKPDFQHDPIGFQSIATGSFYAFFILKRGLVFILFQ